MVKLTVEKAVQVMRLLESPRVEMTPELQELYSGIGEQINQSPPIDTGPLLERLIGVLEAHNTRSILGGKTLRMLRNILLLPSEIRALESRLASGQMACMNCGRDIEHCEGMVVRKDGERDSRFALYCFRCFQPTVIPCETPKCNGVVDMPDVVRRALKKTHGKCEACKTGKLVEQVAPVMIDEDDDDWEDGPGEPMGVPMPNTPEDWARGLQTRAAVAREAFQWTQAAVDAAPPDPRIFRVRAGRGEE